VDHHFLLLGFQRLERDSFTRLCLKFHGRGFFYNFYDIKPHVVIRHERILSLFRANRFTIPSQYARKTPSRLAGQTEGCPTFYHRYLNFLLAVSLERLERDDCAGWKVPMVWPQFN
jgi:hypothetical protein